MRGSAKARAMTNDCKRRVDCADPRRGGAIAVAEGARGIACRGADDAAAEGSTDDAHREGLSDICGFRETGIQFPQVSRAGNLAGWILDGAVEHGAGARVALREGNRPWTYDEHADPGTMSLIHI